MTDHIEIMPDNKIADTTVVADNTSSSGTQRKVFIKTYGCQMNVYDSERMSDALAGDGYVATDDMGEADLILLNTCHIREKAAEKVYSEIGRIRKMRDRKGEAGEKVMLGITGCVAQAEGQEIINRAPSVDFVVGPQTYHRLPSIIERARDGKPVVETEFEIEEKFKLLPKATSAQTRSRGVTAFLTVQEGCDKFCTFCVVPYTRGAEASRSVAQIRDEAKRLVDAGVREITLLGQNVNAWHGAGPTGEAWSLGQLLHELAKVDGLDRLRYTTSHPIDMDDALIEAHRDLDILMPYLHLPVQAGSDRVLKAMNRHHTKAQYLDLIDRIRNARADIAMSGDFIVGFPGETEADFEETLDVIRQVRYASAFSFKYSARPGTPGADMDHHVSEPVMKERLERLQALLNTQQQEFNESCVGKTMDILLEKPAKKDGQLIGRSPWLQSVIVDGNTSQIGEIIPVTVTSGGPNSLQAEAI